MKLDGVRVRLDDVWYEVSIPCQITERDTPRLVRLFARKLVDALIERADAAEAAGLYWKGEPW